MAEMTIAYEFADVRLFEDGHFDITLYNRGDNALKEPPADDFVGFEVNCEGMTLDEFTNYISTQLVEMGRYARRKEAAA